MDLRGRSQTIRLIALTWTVLAASGLALTAALSAHAAWRALEAHAVDAQPTAPLQRIGYEAEDHFPGAALLYADGEPQTDIPAPAAGVTGTTTLPALPIPAVQEAAMASGDTGIVSAPPFSLRRASAQDRARALECLTAAVYYEAASEPDAGQSAVAQVILNRTRHPAFPNTVCGVVYQGSERAGCQFSFACDGSMMRVPMRSAWRRAARTAGMALAGYVYAPVGLATHYHTYGVTPSWNRSLVMTDVIGAHFFHRWKGFWGTAAAFSQPYRGGEPVPGPHVPIAPVPPHAQPMPAAAAVTAIDASLPTRTHADSGMAIRDPAATAKDELPPASPILDRWKDSGKPLL